MMYQVLADPMADLNAAPSKELTVMVWEAPPDTSAHLPMRVALAMVLPTMALLEVAYRLPSMAAVDTGSTTQDRPLIVPRSAIPPVVKVSRMKNPSPICWLVPLPVHPVLPYSLSVEVRVVVAMA